jgi:hypothetical protein
MDKRALLEKITALPYVNCYPTDGRKLLATTYKGSDGIFHVPVVYQNGDFLDFKTAGLVDGAYASENIDDPSQDLQSALLTTIFQSLSFGSLFEPYHKLEADILNAAASIEKNFILAKHYQGSRDSGYRSVMGTEFEYLLVNQRALYDQLQFLMKSLWKLVIQNNKKELPSSFNDLAKYPDEDLIKKFNLPPALRRFVLDSSRNFSIIRDIRTGIEHQGKTIRNFFLFPDGFAVSVKEWPWSQFPIWDECELKPNGLGPYLRFLAWSTREALLAVDRFEQAVRSDIPLPIGQLSKWSIYLRSSHLGHLSRLDSYFSNPWRDVNQPSEVKEAGPSTTKNLSVAPNPS